MKLERLVNIYAGSFEESTGEHLRLRNVLSCFNLQPGYATAPHSTPILQLLNLVTLESLRASADEIEADLLNELTTFTSNPDQLELLLPRPRADELVPGVGRVFVKFPGGVEEAARAASELSGRIFDGRTCIVSFYPEDKYEKRQL
jgi:splicing factor U2AF subunit